MNDKEKTQFLAKVFKKLIVDKTDLNSEDFMILEGIANGSI